jgi:hypothetical protein
MVFKFVFWPYKVKSAVIGWRGWRLWWFGFQLFEACEFWAEYESGTWSSPKLQGLAANDPRFDNDGYFEDPWYPLCDPQDECRCCRIGRVRGQHQHTGFVRGSKPIGRKSW